MRKYLKVCTEDSPEISLLQEKLIKFYNTSEDYFGEENFHPQFWQHIKNKISAKLQGKESCRVLEIGAGCSGLSNYLDDLRERTYYCVQDITKKNEAHLQLVADHIYLQNVEEISDKFDVICASYVFEHLAQPKKVLDHLLSLLNPGGSLFLICPRYDLLPYFPPSARNRGCLDRILLMTWLQSRRIMVALGAKPDFFIDSDPAVLHLPWYRDADAIHWVSLFDLKRYLNGHYKVIPLSLGYKGWHGFLWEKFCLLSVEIMAIG